MREDESNPESRRSVGERLTIEEASRRYVEYLTDQGRKRATIVAV